MALNQIMRDVESQRFVAEVGNNVAPGLREGVASCRDFDQGTVDALLLDLDVATDVGHPLVRFGDRRNQ